MGGWQRLSPGSEMITELYVPRRDLPAFMAEVAHDFRTHQTPVIYGTVRLIERDDETVLAWARQPWACIVFNLHVDHTPEGIERAADAFRRLIDRALAYGGSYYLTYHRWATREQVEAATRSSSSFCGRSCAATPKSAFSRTGTGTIGRCLVKISSAPRMRTCDFANTRSIRIAWIDRAGSRAFQAQNYGGCRPRHGMPCLFR